MEYNVTGDSDRYINLTGQIDGYKVKLTFVKEKASTKPEPEQASSEFITLVSLKHYFKRLTREEWMKFEIEFNKNHDGDIVDWLSSRKKDTLEYVIGGGFVWSETIDGQQYWGKIHDREEDVV
jgi:hypothetical protein